MSGLEELTPPGRSGVFAQGDDPSPEKTITRPKWLWVTNSCGHSCPTEIMRHVWSCQIGNLYERDRAAGHCQALEHAGDVRRKSLSPHRARLTAPRSPHRLRERSPARGGFPSRIQGPHARTASPSDRRRRGSRRLTHFARGRYEPQDGKGPPAHNPGARRALGALGARSRPPCHYSFFRARTALAASAAESRATWVTKVLPMAAADKPRTLRPASASAAAIRAPSPGLSGP